MLTQEIADEFGYDLDVLENYIKNFQPVPELEWLKQYPDCRFITELSDENKQVFDYGWKMLMDEAPDLEITYQDYAENKIVIGGQKRKLFKYLNNQSLAQEIGKYKLPNKKLYLVISINFEDFLMATTGNSWTACTDLRGGDYKFTNIGNIFTNGRFIVYITDKVETEFKGLKSYNKIFRAYGFINDKSEMITNIFYPIKEYLNIDGPNGKIKSVENEMFSKYSFNKIYNKYGYFFYPYLDYSTLENEKFKIENQYIRFKPLVDIGGKIKKYDELFSFSQSQKGEKFVNCLWSTCDICGSVNGEIETIGDKNYCQDCLPNAKQVCAVCSQEKHCTFSEDNSFICDDCIETKYGRKDVSKCSCGTLIRKLKEEKCRWCRSDKEDCFKNIKFDYLNNSSKYSYYLHKHVETIPADLEYNEGIFEAAEMYIKKYRPKNVIKQGNEIIYQDIGWKLVKGNLEKI